MGYRLADNTGDTLAVPQLVLTHLCQTDGDTIRAALYILQTRDTDPRTMARALAASSSSPMELMTCISSVLRSARTRVMRMYPPPPRRLSTM